MAGMSVLIMNSILLPMFNAMTKDESTAWRTVSVVPAVVAFTVGVFMYCSTDDAPRGNYTDIKKTDVRLATRSHSASLRQAAVSANTWVLALQYMCSFGVEIAMKDAAASYFHDTFGLSWEASSAMAGIFGWLDFFARALGGVASDLSHSRWGMRGRLWVQALALLFEGALILGFAQCRTLGGSLAALIFFSLFVKVTEGSTFGIVPYVQPRNIGSIIGITGAGGSLGALTFRFLLRELPGQQGLISMGSFVIASSLLTCAISIRGHWSLLFGIDRNVDPETGSIRSSGSSRAGSDLGSERRQDMTVS
jgi:NNP family nitrate/nitrite transporter-like MFS transporter